MTYVDSKFTEYENAKGRRVRIVERSWRPTESDWYEQYEDDFGTKYFAHKGSIRTDQVPHDLAVANLIPIGGTDYAKQK